MALLELSGGSIQWNMSFARLAHDLEVDVFASLFKVLYLVRVRQKNEDKLWWVPPKEACLLLNPSTMPWVVMTAFISQ